MDYEKTVEFDGDFSKAAETARNTLLPHGFQIVNSNDNFIELEGTRSIVNSGEDPLIGVSWIHIQMVNKSLILKAEFGGVAKTAKLMTVITIASVIVTLGIVGAVLIKQHQPIQKTLLLLIIFAVSPIFIPFFYKYLKFRTIKAVDTLFNNMVALGR